MRCILWSGGELGKHFKREKFPKQLFYRENLVIQTHILSI